MNRLVFLSRMDCLLRLYSFGNASVGCNLRLGCLEKDQRHLHVAGSTANSRADKRILSVEELVSCEESLCSSKSDVSQEPSEDQEGKRLTHFRILHRLLQGIAPLVSSFPPGKLGPLRSSLSICVAVRVAGAFDWFGGGPESKRQSDARIVAQPWLVTRWRRGLAKARLQSLHLKQQGQDVRPVGLQVR